MSSIVTGRPTKTQNKSSLQPAVTCCAGVADIFASPERLKTSAAPDLQTNIRLHDYRLLIKPNSDWVEISKGFFNGFLVLGASLLSW